MRNFLILPTTAGASPMIPRSYRCISVRPFMPNVPILMVHDSPFYNFFLMKNTKTAHNILEFALIHLIQGVKLNYLSASGSNP